MSYNGSAVVGMVGDNCAALACDLRFGVQLQTISTDFSKVHQLGPRLFVGFPGLMTDKQTVFGPYFVEPVVVGLDHVTGNPYVATMDLIGCISESTDFQVGGTCTEQLYGMCETLWEKNMKPAQLFECISQCILNAEDRDCLAGWGTRVYIVEPEQVTISDLKMRMD